MVGDTQRAGPLPPTAIEVFRGYQAGYEAVRQRLRQVGSMLPDGRVGKPSCGVPAPLDPPFAYRTGHLAESNAEMMMERHLVDPDTRMYQDLQNDAADDIAERLASLTGGTADRPS